MKKWKLPDMCNKNFACYKIELCQTCRAALTEYEKSKEKKEKVLDK